MACKCEASPEWMDNILRSDKSESEEDEDVCEEETMDEDFCGFHELDHAYLYLYRVLREDEYIENGIFCKNKDSKRTVAQHIASGSSYESKFISTTLCLKAAKVRAFFEIKKDEITARKVPLRIVKIDIQVLAGTKYEKKCINLCNENVRNHFLKGALHRNWAKSPKEVLFVEQIPKYVTSADEVNTSTHYAQATSFQQPSLPLMTTPFTNELWRTLVYWLIDASRPNTPPPPKKKNKRKGKDSDLVHMMSSMNL